MNDFIENLIIDAIFFGIPAVAIIFIVVSLFLFISARKKNKKVPSSVNEQKLESRKAMLIMSVIIGVPPVAIIGGLMYVGMAIMESM